jgi:ABC-2 type transport system ATP-binding protein
MNAITIKDLKKTYKNGTQALKGINLEVKEGDFCALLGANGAGKTTIIGILTGLVVKSSGQANIFDVDIEKDFAKAKQMIGVVPQEMNFNMFENVMDIIVNQAGFFGIERKVAQKDAEEILRKLSLWEKRNSPSRTLSGGMKRRLMIARSLINRPKLLILDEPTAGVDVELRHSMWQFLNELNKSGTTILLTTHYLEEVEQMCRHAAIIKNGEIIAYDKVRTLINMVEVETYVVHVDRVHSLEKLSQYKPLAIDETTFELEIKSGRNLHEFMDQVFDLGMVIRDLRPKGNRMEKLFLKILKQD